MMLCAVCWWMRSSKWHRCERHWRAHTGPICWANLLVTINSVVKIKYAMFLLFVVITFSQLNTELWDGTRWPEGTHWPRLLSHPPRYNHCGCKIYNVFVICSYYLFLPFSQLNTELWDGTRWVALTTPEQYCFFSRYTRYFTIFQYDAIYRDIFTIFLRR